MPLNNFRSPRMHVRSIPCSVGILGAQKNRHYSVSASPLPADVALEICSNGTEGDAAGWISLCPGRGMAMYGVTQTNCVGAARQGTRWFDISQTRHYRESRGPQCIRFTGVWPVSGSRRSIRVMLLEHGLGALLYLIGRQFFLVGRKKPDVSERVFQCAGSVAVQLVLHRFDDRCARANSPIKDGVHIFDVQCRPTGGPSDVCGLRNGLSPPQSSAIMMRESPIWISACPTLPPGASSLNDSVAPKARR